MKSIKPGRGPSMLSGVVGLFMVGFGILWTMMAARIDSVFALFGILWIGIVIAMTVYHFKNATSKNRYSAYDITDEKEETDPLNERFRDSQTDEQKKHKTGNQFCPYCGTPVAGDFKFCSHCGKKLQ